jgi:hypothetical protein
MPRALMNSRQRLFLVNAPISVVFRVRGSLTIRDVYVRYQGCGDKYVGLQREDYAEVSSPTPAYGLRGRNDF